VKQAFDVTAEIDRPAAEVWAVLTDWENGTKWMSGIDRMSIDGETAEGAKVTFHARGKDRASTISACEPGRSVTLRSVQGGVTAEYVYAVEAIDDARTRVRLTAGCATEGVLWALMYPLIRVAIKMSDGGQMDALKRVVEGTDS
jgi:uncharacterized protein YndB with AHSA1/START domain